MFMHSQPVAPYEKSYTHWHNPTKDTITVDLYDGVFFNAQGISKGPPRRSNWSRVVWKPGETKILDSEYDNEIHRTVDGVIVGGKAPQLMRTDAPEHRMHDSLDVELAKLKAESEAAVHALSVKSAAEQALILATARAQAAEAAKASAAEKKHGK